MFIARRDLSTLLYSEERHRSNLTGIAMPLFRTEPEEMARWAINIALLRSEGLTLFCSSLTFAKGPEAYRTFSKPLCCRNE